jgi:hypothetical protein
MAATGVRRAPPSLSARTPLAPWRAPINALVRARWCKGQASRPRQPLAATPSAAVLSSSSNRRRRPIAAAAAAAAAASPLAAATPTPRSPSSSSSWRDEVADACADPLALAKLTLRGRVDDPTGMPYRQATARPVEARGGSGGGGGKDAAAAAAVLCISTLTAKQDLTRNYRPGDTARRAVRDLLDFPWRSASLVRADGSGLRVQFSRKGRELVTRQRAGGTAAGGGASSSAANAAATPTPSTPAAAAAAPPVLLPSHDRRKTSLPLPPDEPDPFLQRLGLQSSETGKCKADSRRKLAQVNALLRLLDATGVLEDGLEQEKEEEEDNNDKEEERESAGLLLGKEEVHVLDAGCGASVLTFGIYRHLQKKAAAAARATATARAGSGAGAGAAVTRVRLTGIDTNAELMRRSAEHARALLDPSDLPASFLAMAIRDYDGAAAREQQQGGQTPPPVLPPPDIVLALHACDGATDEALALAVRTRARLILAVPCCMATMHRDYAARVKKAGKRRRRGSGDDEDDDKGDALLRAAVLRASARGSSSSSSSGSGESAVPPPPLPPPPPAELALAALLRHATLRNRLLDLATDSMRAALLRCLGYRADAVEFVPTEHTPRNLLLRAVLPAASRRRGGLSGRHGGLPLDRGAVREYRQMRAFFGGVAPPLEAMLERDGQLPGGWLDEEEED